MRASQPVGENDGDIVGLGPGLGELPQVVQRLLEHVAGEPRETVTQNAHEAVCAEHLALGVAGGSLYPLAEGARQRFSGPSEEFVMRCFVVGLVLAVVGARTETFAQQRPEALERLEAYRAWG